MRTREIIAAALSAYDEGDRHLAELFLRDSIHSLHTEKLDTVANEAGVAQPGELQAA